jgi:general secretion pathway protein H
LVVLAIIALASATVSLSLRDSAQNQLQSEAERLIAVLEATRADARASNSAMRWHANNTGFEVHTQTNKGDTVHAMAWLYPGIQASPTDVLISAEPIQARTTVTLRHDNGASLNIGSDGAAPFKVMR